jgi:hypothetical protein
MGIMTSPGAYENDCEDVMHNCPYYKKLYKDLNIEKMTPIKKSIEHFCVKANYKQETEFLVTNKKLNEEIRVLFEECSIAHSYDSIEDIDYQQVEFITMQMFGNMATMQDKFALKKFYFQQNFKEDNDKSLAEIWNANHFFFFESLRYVLLNPDNIFNQIAEFNGLDNLFSNNMKKIKLNDTLIDRIFSEYSFKYLTKYSSHISIVKEICTTAFGCIYLPTFNNNKHVTYELREYIYEYVTFGKENLIL